MPKPIDVNEFARFINQPVKVARAILEQDALYDCDPRPIHDGYDYARQEWVK